MPEDFDLSDNPFVPNYFGNPILGKEAEQVYRKIRKTIEFEFNLINTKKGINTLSNENKSIKPDNILFPKEDFIQLYVEKFS